MKKSEEFNLGIGNEVKAELKKLYKEIFIDDININNKEMSEQINEKLLDIAKQVPKKLMPVIGDLKEGMDEFARGSNELSENIISGQENMQRWFEQSLNKASSSIDLNINENSTVLKELMVKNNENVSIKIDDIKTKLEYLDNSINEKFSEIVKVAEDSIENIQKLCDTGLETAVSNINKVNEKTSEDNKIISERLSKIEEKFESKNLISMYINIGQVVLIIILMIIIFTR